MQASTINALTKARQFTKKPQALSLVIGGKIKPVVKECMCLRSYPPCNF